MKPNEMDSIHGSLTAIPWKLYTIYADTAVSSKSNLLKLFQDSLKIYVLCRGIKNSFIDQIYFTKVFALIFLNVIKY